MGRPAKVESMIVCIDCLGPAYLLSSIGPEDVVEVGDIISYRCRDCNDRWDIVADGGDESILN